MIDKISYIAFCVLIGKCFIIKAFYFFARNKTSCHMRVSAAAAAFFFQRHHEHVAAGYMGQGVWLKISARYPVWNRQQLYPLLPASG